MKNQRLDFKKMLAGAMGLPSDIMLDLPRVSIVGDLTIIENHKGLITFSDSEIRLLIPKGELQIRGTSFNIKAYSITDFILSGKVEDVKFIERK